MAFIAVFAIFPSADATTDPGTGGSCDAGTHVTPPRPDGHDWDNGVDLTLLNCTDIVKFAEVVCHVYPSVGENKVCWSYRIPAHDFAYVSVPSNRQVHMVRWY
jgi:hypothetical protein